MTRTATLVAALGRKPTPSQARLLRAMAAGHKIAYGPGGRLAWVAPAPSPSPRIDPRVVDALLLLGWASYPLDLVVITTTGRAALEARP